MKHKRVSSCAVEPMTLKYRVVISVEVDYTVTGSSIEEIQTQALERAIKEYPGKDVWLKSWTEIKTKNYYDNTWA